VEVQKPQRLTVLMPVYNERSTLQRAVEGFLKTPLPIEAELLLIDDGSTDGSLETIADLADAGAVRVVRHRSNQGKGSAIRTGLSHAGGDLVTVLDADLEYDPADYKGLIDAIEQEQASVAYGTRSFGSHTAYSFWYVVGNRLLSLWASLLFNTWLSDIETCFKMARLEAWRSLDIGSKGFGIEAEVTAKLLRQGHRIYEVPINYRARGREEGKKLRWTDGVAALWIILRIRIFGR
jgi:dolichol-phosphate hexosyltransferase